MIWVKAITWHIQKMVVQQIQDASDLLSESDVDEPEEDEEQVEVIRPSETED